jgi:hypothetical protein
MRRAFIMPSVILLLVVFTLAAGSLMAGTTSLVKRMKWRVAYREQIAASELGMKLAEDWLLSSIGEGFIPKMAQSATGSALSKIEAVRPDGGRVPASLSFDKFDISLYVADTDYSSILDGMSIEEKEPGIPMIPESYVPGKGLMRCYFLRSAAASGLWKSKLACEELLAVSLDLSGRIQAVTRLFYSSDSAF